MRLLFALAFVPLVAALGCEDTPVKLDMMTKDAGLSTEWTVVKPPANVDYMAVSGSGAMDVVMVGRGGAIARWDGMQLKAEDSGTMEDLHGVFSVSPMVAYAVGAGGTILQWNGTAWTATMAMSTVDGGAPPFLSAVWADSATNAVAVGQAGAAYQWNGTAWKPIPTASPDNLLAVTSAGGTVLAFGTLGTVDTLQNGTFNRTAIPGYAKTLAGATSGPGGTYVVGVDGAVFQYNGGNNFEQLNGFPSVFLRAAAAPEAGTLWVVGWDATVVRDKSAVIFVYPNIPQRWPQGVYASSPSDVWVVGTSGLVLHGPPPMDPPLPDGGAS